MLRIKAAFLSLVFIQFDMSVDMKIINIISSLKWDLDEECWLELLSETQLTYLKCFKFVAGSHQKNNAILTEYYSLKADTV
jgi:hypothetical protein